MPARKILLIDDSADDAFLMERALKRVDPDVEFQWVEDGEKGLARLENYEGDWHDIIFLDIKMPKITGLEILEDLHKRKKLASFRRINVLSSSVLKRDVDAALQYANVAYSSKPAGYAALRGLLRDPLADKTTDQAK